MSAGGVVNGWAQRRGTAAGLASAPMSADPMRAGGLDRIAERFAEATVAGFYEDWKRDGLHLAEYAAEFVGTAFNVFWVVGIVSVMFGASSPAPHAIPSAFLRLFVLGLFLGGVSWLVALSPPGKLSGAHLNPAVSLGFWLLGKMHARDAAGYIVAQMAGAAVGALAGSAAFGQLANEVAHATLHPGVGVGPLGATLGEVVATFVLTFLVYTFLSHARLRPYTPPLAMLMVGVLIAIDGSYSGAGMNPARWFGPAFTLAYWHLFAVYIFGPVAGSTAAALSRRSGRLGPSMPHSGKIVHDRSYRSIFMHETAPSTPPHSVHQKAMMHRR